jgi:hypothetical protein
VEVWDKAYQSVFIVGCVLFQIAVISYLFGAQLVARVRKTSPKDSPRFSYS